MKSFGVSKQSAYGARSSVIVIQFSWTMIEAAREPRIADPGVRGSEAPLTEMYAALFETPFGWIACAFRAERLLAVTFGHATRDKAARALRRLGSPNTEFIDVFFGNDLTQLPALGADVIVRLRRYTQSLLVDFSNLEIDESGLTPFARRVVEACRGIPYGETRSYGEVAKITGSPGAARAVGRVMASNRCPLVVPCHRVVASGGAIGGFSAPQGKSMKLRLLQMEKAVANV